MEGFEPRWLSGLAAVRWEHGRRLAALVGRRLTAAWLAWELDGDCWWNDAPVVFDFGGEQLEISHRKFDELSITWNSIQVTRPPADPMFQIAWRDDMCHRLTALHGQVLSSVALLEWQGEQRDLGTGAVAVHLAFTSGGSVTVANALDENELDFGAPGPHWRRHALSPEGRS
ncbi:hypothetical protein L1857_05370 [Amycolatopsis thermalba]|uniref:Uncharacterized protein n=1 Tax=Amycolatopsis thermalba TaxID=944492 RepID=A0ABY4NRB1_9PSEU|nr:MULTISPECIES: hypothetical protein [Amycolatopsis]UQS22291.1 hypothetical protein L1857_05370 [Amycolatopsis thermalba]